jgi:hypothetical protein
MFAVHVEGDKSTVGALGRCSRGFGEGDSGDSDIVSIVFVRYCSHSARSRCLSKVTGRLGIFWAFCEGVRKVACPGLRVESQWNVVDFVRVRSSERLLRLANIDRVFGLSLSEQERMGDTGCSGQGRNCVLFSLTPDSSLLPPLPVHVFLSHPAGGFNNYFWPRVCPCPERSGPRRTN